LVNTTYK